MADPTRVPKRGAVGAGSDGTSWRRWVLFAAVLLLAIIALQNSQKVEIRLLFVETQTPLIIGLLIAGALGAVIGYVGPMVSRHRRNERRRNDQPDD